MNTGKLHSIALSFEFNRFSVFVNCGKLTPIHSDCHGKRLKIHPNFIMEPNKLHPREYDAVNMIGTYPVLNKSK